MPAPALSAVATWNKVPASAREQKSPLSSRLVAQPHAEWQSGSKVGLRLIAPIGGVSCGERCVGMCARDNGDFPAHGLGPDQAPQAPAGTRFPCPQQPYSLRCPRQAVPQCWLPRRCVAPSANLRGLWAAHLPVDGSHERLTRPERPQARHVLVAIHGGRRFLNPSSIISGKKNPATSWRT